MSHMSVFCILTAVTFVFTVVNCSSLEIVTDDELLNLFRNEKYVVVLFTKKDCEECDNYESAMLRLREDLVDTLNAWVVKAVNSQLVRLYDPSKEPALVFFRHGIPLLYRGELNEDMILHTFAQNKEPIVRELSDDNFEHLTQASSGATTGDWFVMFYSVDCIDCQRLQARWETIGAELKTRMNVARVNRKTTGAITSRRFNVFDVPTFILFQRGKMYRYNIAKYDIDSLLSFVQVWYKNVRMETVPVPKSPFDDFTQMVADYLKENPLTWKVGVTALCIVIILAMVSKLRGKKKPEKKSKKSK